jgi:hypothetical protein
MGGYNKQRRPAAELKRREWWAKSIYNYSPQQQRSARYHIRDNVTDDALFVFHLKALDL